jgi:hypothetical protein
MLPWSDWVVPSARKTGDEGEARITSLPGFDTRTMLSKKAARMGDKAKPSGVISERRRLCCLSSVAQYKIIKIKFVASMIAVTPATASSKASLASW